MLQVTAYADETVYKQINLSAEQFSYDSASRVIQKALNEARDNATDYLPYQINIPAGAYYLDTTLFVYTTVPPCSKLRQRVKILLKPVSTR